MILHYGGAHGGRGLGLVESALNRPRSGFGDYEQYPDIFSKSAVLLHSLLKNHPFLDGNKRTALASCAIFLKRNGYTLKMPKVDGLEFVLNIENDTLDEKAITEWINNHTHKIT